MKEIETGGPSAMMKYWNDPAVGLPLCAHSVPVHPYALAPFPSLTIPLPGPATHRTRIETETSPVRVDNMQNTFDGWSLPGGAEEDHRRDGRRDAGRHAGRGAGGGGGGGGCRDSQIMLATS